MTSDRLLAKVSLDLGKYDFIEWSTCNVHVLVIHFVRRISDGETDDLNKLSKEIGLR